MQQITLPTPDDWHLHVRDGIYLQRSIDDTIQRYARAIIMPNLNPPISTLELAHAYRQRILACIPKAHSFQPLMTLYLTDTTSQSEIEQAAVSDFVYAAKLYPAHATTHSAHGVTDIKKRYPIFEVMQRLQFPLLLHGEVTDPTIDIFDREAVFIDRYLSPLLRDFPELNIVLEHITTATAVDFILEAKHPIAATITPHHLLYNRNQLLAGGIKPHYYCLPILKRSRDQLKLIQAATSGHEKFFLGTDSAPHAKSQKENACGCAGIYSAHASLELYAEVFDRENALTQLAQFAAYNGAKFYGLPYNATTITLKRNDWQVAEELSFGDETLIPLRAGQTIHWQLG
ncbi:MAG: dihydroorotase [Legionellales bacterium]|nr:dihydroorotase [Legionellales bacterium]